ncbi:unnamed protein product [Chrysoparadoxa australica]
MAEIAGFDSIPLLMASSLIYLIASSSACNDYCDGYTIWAVIVAVVSLAVTGGIVALKATGRGSLITRVHQHIAVFLFVLWLLGAALGTFKRPFPFVGNGYFSAWISFGVSTLYAYASSAKVPYSSNVAPPKQPFHLPDKQHSAFPPQRCNPSSSSCCVLSLLTLTCAVVANRCARPLTVEWGQ